MARYLTVPFLRAALNRGGPVQQLLSAETVDGKWKVRWIELNAAKDGYHLYCHDDERSIWKGFFDVSEWSEPDDPKVFLKLDDAIRFVVEELGGSPDKFVNHGLIDDEVRDVLGPDL